MNQQEDTDDEIILEVMGLTRACVESNVSYLKRDQIFSALYPLGAVDSVDQQ